MPAINILSLPVLTTVFHIAIAAAVITVCGPLFFGGLAPIHWGAYILLTVLSLSVFGAIGALIGVIAENNRLVVLLSQLIFLPSMLIGGLMMPLDILPASIRPVSALLPTTYAMQAYLGLAYGQETVIDPRMAVAVLLSGGLLAFGLAIYLFNWDSRNRTRRGHPLLALLALLPYVVGAFLA